MEALGRLFNIVPVASGVHISLRHCDAVTFVVYEDGGATSIALKESIAGASEQALTRTRRWSSNGVGASQVWTTRTFTANATIPKTDDTDQDCVVICVSSEELSDGFDSVELTIDAGVCIAIQHDLKNQRIPDNLPAPVLT